MSIELFKSIIQNPIPYAHKLGLTKLRENTHAEWIRRAFFLGRTKHLEEDEGDTTTQAHRGSYKSSCVRVGLGLRIIGLPFANTIMQRKTDTDVKDIITAISKDLQSDMAMSLMKGMYGVYPTLTTNTYAEIELSTYRGVMGRQLLGIGIGSSITGKHGPVITDDIVTLKDRLSGAERERTKAAYQELINIASEEGQYIQNWGTPWHKEDAFSLMPKPEVHTVYETGIIKPEEIQKRKNSMSPSLFAANYELKHIADGDVLFNEPKYGKFPIGAKAYAHIDAAYGGGDFTALTVAAEVNGNIHIVGWLMPGHVETHYTSIISRIERFQAIQLSCETNADKGYLKKELSKMTDISIVPYHEKTNKYYKISTYGKGAWNRVILDIDQSDLDYVSQIMDYNENATHDDAPDSFSSLIRWKFSKRKASINLSGRF